MSSPETAAEEPLSDPYADARVSPSASPDGISVADSGPTVVDARGDTTVSSTPPTPATPSKLENGAFLEKDPYRGKLRRQHIKDLKDRAKKRSEMMKWAVRLCGFTVGMSALIMLLYMISHWGKTDGAVMISWFASVVAQIIGIVFVMANYLFPKDDHSMEEAIKHFDGEIPKT
ncbi:MULTISPECIES: hypothetical protein [Arthrobacter]|uniref:2TM domain-containing protein n=2 Tax=Arthrobacter TaxID=1663 RepID=A0ABU9KHI7_9MICC|nr:hypothetical protein [Arthrobacter sp. YJM1]MDP5226624.1 hypothetical protein [Arthrobacter sp. YJM1]